MWQQVREELHPQGVEVVTVALETRGAGEAARWIEAAAPQHPSLIDEAHLLDELYGVVNVPSGIWIDEAGRIVRPPETAFPGVARFSGGELPAEGRLREVMLEARKIRIQPERYLEALRDWARQGAASRYALTPEQVLARSRRRSPETARAAAHFELGQHLQRAGLEGGARAHFREAHRLQPDNWTYKRQAWALVDRAQGPTAVYPGNWLDDVRQVGAENYYQPLDM